MMPLYEGIALIQEKQPVVLDLGYDFTKFGFGGEAAPRCIIPSEFWSNKERRMKRVFDYQTQDELFENLVDMLHLLYFKHISVNPKERKVIIVESLLTPTVFRETLAKVLFLHYEVSAVVWADSSRVCALTLGTMHALVLDIGAREAEVVPVVHGMSIINAIKSAPLAGRHIAEELSKMIAADNPTCPPLEDKHLHDIIAKCCFVGSRERWAQWQASADDVTKAPAPAKDIAYPINGTTIKISGKTRELAASGLFTRDNEMSSIPDMILQAIMKSPIDARRALAGNILVVGGTANLPGLVHRLSMELNYLKTQPPYHDRFHNEKFLYHTVPLPRVSAAWLGAALADSLVCGAALTRDTYCRDRESSLPDWVSLLHNTPKTHSSYVQYLNEKNNGDSKTM